MKGKRFTEEQIIGVLKEAEGGQESATCAASRASLRPPTTGGKSKYGGLEVSEAKRLRALEQEDRRLKQLVADKELDILGLRAALSKKY